MSACSGRDQTTDAAGEAFRQGRTGVGAAASRWPAHRPGRPRRGPWRSITGGRTTGRDLARYRFDFSFSGLKTAVHGVQLREAAGESVPVADVAASFQEAVVDVLTRKAVAAAAEQGVDDLLIGGGVAANLSTEGAGAGAP